MKIGKITTALFLSTAMSFEVSCAFELPEKNSLMARILKATDERDHENIVFEEAVKAGKYESLAYLGQIGGDACEKLVPYLRGENQEAKRWAVKGAMLCHDDKLSPHLTAQLADAEHKSLWSSALGFSGGDGSAAIIAASLKLADSNQAQLDTLFGLVQSVAYSRTSAADIPGLDLKRILEQVVAGGDVGYAAAYVLARLQNLPDMLPFADFEPVLAAMLSNNTNDLTGAELETARLLTRVAREYGDDALQLLLAASEADQIMIRHEAVRSFGHLKDATSKAFILKLANSDETASLVRHLAVDAIGQRSMADPSLLDLLHQYISDDDRWVATTALRWLGQRDAVAANEVAAEWLAGNDYYLAFQALIALTGSDDGKTILKAYADANPKTVRGYEAAVALDPSIEAVVKPRKTPNFSTVAAYANRELVLETTRGKVCIAVTGDAPYAAANFLQLADVGKMDGMLWHRVIPNFVTQAGQIEDTDINNWGSIREEWGGEHRIGTVGVATAGRDTGTVQFFVNTGYNLHLNNRYTVFGKVYGGMDVIYKLQEGDVIKRAYTAKAPSANCK